ncbi:hypothetical protein P691DRAFT_376672 [Macrolepiota fuliginosa MF-IS2]|uniref:Uncharacterized protein n=1 Tax=Macrolepiota fuliginosa MF-IS2 TaxID=1400762 RepID=A0A9P5X653_9AGAR|nr:hypothetical protein P691DRAFT_376672 [Macrolepiota fuliginosa MF-IS2]
MHLPMRHARMSWYIWGVSPDPPPATIIHYPFFTTKPSFFSLVSLFSPIRCNLSLLKSPLFLSLFLSVLFSTILGQATPSIRLFPLIHTCTAATH